jgi:hypothetical protein
MRRFLDWLSDPKRSMALGIGLTSVGLDLVFRGIQRRLDSLESRGWTPIDDVATVNDLNELERRVARSGLRPADEPGEDPAP